MYLGISTLVYSRSQEKISYYLGKTFFFVIMTKITYNTNVVRTKQMQFKSSSRENVGINISDPWPFRTNVRYNCNHTEHIKTDFERYTYYTVTVTHIYSALACTVHLNLEDVVIVMSSTSFSTARIQYLRGTIKNKLTPNSIITLTSAFPTSNQ